jgi:hypothetical protein
MRRVLAPGGRLLLVLHIIPRWLVPFRRVLDRIDAGHPHHLSNADVRRMLSDARFAETESHTESPQVGWYSLKAALGNLAMRSLRVKCEAAALTHESATP